MKTSHLRDEDNCLNCGKQVEVRYCSHCGQENSKLDQAFYFAFLSYFQNKAKYDKSLLKSIQLLIHKPGYLSREFLKGKRASYIEPVRFYIAISFIVFFFTSIMFSFHQKHSFRLYDESDDELLSYTEEKVSTMDRQALQKYPSLYFISHPFYEKLKELKLAGWSNEEISESLLNRFVVNIPTALFLYLPIFAFTLWLAFIRKRTIYYNHSIFSLHFFTTLLLLFFIWYLLETVQIIAKSTLVDRLVNLMQALVYVVACYYFIRAAFVFYDLKKPIMIFKAFFLLCLNIGSFAFLLLIMLYYTFVSID